MVKLRETDVNDGANLGREIEVSQEQADDLFARQAQRGVIAWVEVKEGDEKPAEATATDTPAEQAPATQEAPKADNKQKGK